MKQQAIIYMLDGDVWKGTMDTSLSASTFAGGPGNETERFDLHFESNDVQRRGRLPFDRVRIIYLDAGSDSQLHPSLRFFDSVPVPSFLWIRLTFVDGGVIEGMAKNEWATFNGPLIALSLPDPDLDQVPALIPRSAIAELQIITTR